MAASSKILRIAALLFFLAGVLLLQKPLFSQAITAAPTRFSVVIEGVAPGKGPDVLLIPGLASSRDVYAAEAKLLITNYRLHLIQIAGFAGEPAGPNAPGPILGPVVEQLHQYIVVNHPSSPTPWAACLPSCSPTPIPKTSANSLSSTHCPSTDSSSAPEPP